MLAALTASLRIPRAAAILTLMLVAGMWILSSLEAAASATIRLDDQATAAAPLGSDEKAAQHPTTGTVHPALARLDDAVLAFMIEHDIPGAVFALSRNGEMLVSRGYGWRDADRSEAMPHDALLRIASVTKPLVASAVRALIADGALALDDLALDLPTVAVDGTPTRSGGVLEIEPWPALGDERLRGLTIEHLLHHRGGWNRSIAGDLTYWEIAIAESMGLESPPGRMATLRWILGQPLQFDPGTESSYSNIGFLALGLIVEARAGTDLVSFLHDRVLAPIGVPRDDVKLGKTAQAQRDPREPHYWRSDAARNVLDPKGEPVPRPYGGWHHEARVGQGGLIASASALVRFLDHRFVNGPSIGSPAGAGRWRWNHAGSLPGSRAIARQIRDADGARISYAVLFNGESSTVNFSSAVRELLDGLLDGPVDGTSIEWPAAGQSD